MKEEQLIDALGKIDDAFIAESNPFAETGPSFVIQGEAKRETKASSPRRRRNMFLIAVCAVLLLSSIAAYAAGGVKGLLRILRENGTDGDGTTTVEYTTIEDVKIPMSAFHGEIKNAPKEIKKQYDDFLKLPEMQRFASSKLPTSLYKSFATVEEALDYIGYAGMVYPNLEYPKERIGIEIQGYSPVDAELSEQGSMLSSEYEKAKAEEEYSLEMFTLMVDMKYDSASDCFCQSWATFFTENAGPLCSTRIGLSEKAKLATEERTAGGRTFSLLHVEEPDSGKKLLFTDVFLTEDNIVFTFHITYSEDNRAEAETVITQWMNSFRAR